MSCVTNGGKTYQPRSMLPPSKGRLIGSRSRKRGKRLALTIADFCNKIGTKRTNPHVRFGRYWS